MEPLNDGTGAFVVRHYDGGSISKRIISREALQAIRPDTVDHYLHGVDNVGESSLTIERVIARSRLLPCRGSGWHPV